MAKKGGGGKGNIIKKVSQKFYFFIYILDNLSWISSPWYHTECQDNIHNMKTYRKASDTKMKRNKPTSEWAWIHQKRCFSQPLYRSGLARHTQQWTDYLTTSSRMRSSRPWVQRGGYSYKSAFAQHQNLSCNYRNHHHFYVYCGAQSFDGTRTRVMLPISRLHNFRILSAIDLLSLRWETRMPQESCGSCMIRIQIQTGVLTIYLRYIRVIHRP